MKKETLHIVLYAISFLSLIALTWFINDLQDNLQCKSIDVKINDNSTDRFITEKMMRNIITPKDSLFGLLKDYKIQKIEEDINKHVFVKKADAYNTIDGKIILSLTQRQPIARIFSNAESYYLDTDGAIMPLSNSQVARVLIVNGSFYEPYDRCKDYNFTELTDSLKQKTLLDEIYKIASYIHNSSFWRVQIEQLYVNKDLEFELIPKVGNHKIVIGEIDGLEKKLTKMMLFYKKGLKKTGWNEFTEINLKYENQVVCTKRYE